MDVVTRKQTTATAGQTVTMWTHLRKLLTRLEVMDREAPEGSRTSLAMEDLLRLHHDLIWAVHRVELAQADLRAQATLDKRGI